MPKKLDPTCGEQFAAREEIHFAWGRILFLYGPGKDRRRAVPALIHALLQGRPFAVSTGTQVHDYLHVDDVASGFVRLALARASGIYNISSGAPITVQVVMRTVGQILGKEDLIHFGKAEPRSWDPPHICGDSSRLTSLGWGPQYDLERGLNDAIDYCRSTEAPGA